MTRSRFIPLSKELAEKVQTDAFHYDVQARMDAHDEVMVTMVSVFDNDGNFPTGYDPYRTYYDDATWQKLHEDVRRQHLHFMEIHKFLFDERSSVPDFIHSVLAVAIDRMNWSWRSDAVKLFYAQEHGANTSGSYPATYMWS